jgi:hypothetical protein
MIGVTVWATVGVPVPSTVVVFLVSMFSAFSLNRAIGESLAFCDYAIERSTYIQTGILVVEESLEFRLAFLPSRSAWYG